MFKNHTLSGLTEDQRATETQINLLPHTTEHIQIDRDPTRHSYFNKLLGHLYNPAGIAIIASYTSHPDENIRFSVACALGHFLNDSEAVAKLLTLTHDSDSDVRDWAVFGLGVQGDADFPEIRDALMERITDGDEDVREEALVGLCKRRDLRILSVLRRFLDAPELKVRVAEAASVMLGLSSDPEEWEAADYMRALDETFGAESANNLQA